MNNQILIDLKDITNKDELLSKLGEVFEFGGPDGNMKVTQGVKKGWGMNFDALNDSLTCLEDGGIWTTGKKFIFPLEVIFINIDGLKNNAPEDLRILMEIFEDTSNKYQEEGKKFVVEFK